MTSTRSGVPLPGRLRERRPRGHRGHLADMTDTTATSVHELLIDADDPGHLLVVSRWKSRNTRMRCCADADHPNARAAAASSPNPGAGSSRSCRAVTLETQPRHQRDPGDLAPPRSDPGVFPRRGVTQPPAARDPGELDNAGQPGPAPRPAGARSR